MAYGGVYVFGDSLVDAGNALKLAQWYGTLTLSDLPDGAPTASKGYVQGRFANGYTFADLIANNAVGTVTKPIFPYRFEDPWIGVEIAPWTTDPGGNNLNFAYGGAQVRQGEEVVPDLDGQTDAFRDAVDGDAPSDALYIVTMGGNDVRNLAKAGSDPAPVANAQDALDEVAQQLRHELGQLIEDGARHFLITGIPDVGLIPDYDHDDSGDLDPVELARAQAATLYSQYLDNLIRTDVVPALQKMGATVTYVPMMDHQSGTTTVSGGLTAILPTLEALYDLAPGSLTTNLLAHRNLVFFDDVHPTAQVHALFGSYAQALLSKTAWVETLPLEGADVDFRAGGSIAAAGEVDRLVFALAAGTEYRFDLLGISALGATGSLADPALRLLSGTTLVAANADSGVGFDAMLNFTATGSSTYTLELGASGSLTGAYQLQASVIGGAAMGNFTSYTVSSAATLVIEAVGGGIGDTVNASTSYALTAGSEIELLQTTNAKGKGAIALTGNEFAQTIKGNAGANVIEGKGGADILTGGNGSDTFVLSATALAGSANIDRITDYGQGDLVDVAQVLQVAAGTNVLGGGFLRVTTSGLIQVDITGGGDQWTTLSQINGGGAVNVRYLSGGQLATVSASRVAETYALMAASVAAAGVAVLPGSEPVAGSADSSLALASAALMPSTGGVEPAPADLTVARAVASGREGSFMAALDGEAARHWAALDLAASEVALAAQGHGPMPLLAATDLPAAPMPAVATAIAMPAPAAGAQGTAELGRILADALGQSDGGPDIAALLDALPAAAPGLARALETSGPPADLVAAPPAMPAAGLEALAMHADAPAAV